MRHCFPVFLLIFLAITSPVKAQEPAATAAPVINEGAGLIRSDLNGALPKGLWRNQYRSEIAYLLKNLPTQASSRAMQTIKRNMLVSTYDTRSVINDIPATNGNDLLSLRLQKLLELGFWKDALKLYTENVADPGTNDALAQIGLMLILNERGLSTACLEEKVLYPRFADKPFWQQIDKVCSIELGMTNDTIVGFPNSSILQGIYFDKNFKVAVNDVDTLAGLSPLELSLLTTKAKIDYTSIDLAENTPPILTKTFLEDERFPKTSKGKLENLALFQALRPFEVMTESQTKRLEDVATLPQDELLRLIIQQLRLGLKISEESGKRLIELASNHPENYFFVEFLQNTGNIYGNQAIERDNFNPVTEALRKKHPQDVILLQSTLDKPVQFSNNPDTVYEKQISLTPDGGYVMSMGSLEEWLDMAFAQQFSGLSLLIILSNDENIANGTNDTNVIKSLSTVGLINQAHLIAKERLVNLMKASI